MKKFLLGAAVTAAMTLSTANAAITLVGGKPVINPADTYQIFLSGASASRVFIEQSMLDTTVPVAQRICTGAVYSFEDNINGANQNAYLCVGNTANPTLAPLLAGTRKNILLYRRSAGGSAFGVQPILNESNTVNNTTNNIAFLRVNPNTPTTTVGRPTVSAVTPCTLKPAPAVNTFVCPYSEGTIASHASSTWTRADFGVSDVDPRQFVGTNTPSGFTPVPVGALPLVIKSAFAQNFGIVVNVNLRNALQAAQGKPVGSELVSAQPSLTSAQVKNILQGLAPGGVGFPAIPAGKSLHICGRTNGSGTKAATAIKFLRYPCVAGAPSPKADTGAALDASGVTLVHQMGSSGNLEECLGELNTGTNTLGTAFNNIWGSRFALGYQGTENNANNSKLYRFVKIDGQEPTLSKAFNNSYIDWVESTYQYNNTPTSHLFGTTNPLFVSGTRQIIDEIIKQTANPIVIGRLNNPQATQTWGQAGFASSPVNFVAPLALDVNNPVYRLSHARRTPATPVNDCATPIVY